MAMVELAKITRLLRGKLNGIVLFTLLAFSQNVAGQVYSNDTSHYFVYFEDPTFEYDPSCVSSCGTGVDAFRVYHTYGGASHLIVNGSVTGAYYGVDSLIEVFGFHADKYCPRPKTGEYRATWDMSIQFNSNLYGLFNEYQIGVQYPPYITNNNYNYYFSPDSYISIGITPPRPTKIKDSNNSELPNVTEGQVIALKPYCKDVGFPADSNMFSYEVYYSAFETGSWTKYKGTVPAFSGLKESYENGRRLYLKTRILRKNESESNPVKYSPYLTSYIQVLPKVNADVVSLEELTCKTDTAKVVVNVGEISEGYIIEMFVDEVLKKTFTNQEQNSFQDVYLPKGKHVIHFQNRKNVANTPFINSTDSIIVEVRVKELPSLSLDVLMTKWILCNGDLGEIKLSGSGGGGRYTYSAGDGIFNLLDLKSLGAGHYTLSVKDCNDNVASKDIVISEPDLLKLNLSNIKPVNCKGGNDGKIEFSVTGGTLPYADFKLRHGVDSLLSNVNLFSGINAGTGFFIAAKDAYGCVDTLKNIDIPEPVDSLSLNFESYGDISCPGGIDGYIELSASGGTPGYEYSRDGISWEKVQSICRFENLSRKDSIFFARDTLGCLDTLYHPLAQPQPIRVNEKLTNVTCFGDSNGSININLSGGTPLYSIVFSDSNGNSSAIADFSGETIFSNLESGDFSLKITDYNSCADSSTFRIEQPLLPLSMNVDSAVNPTCYGYANGIIRLNPLGGWGSYTFNHVDSSVFNKTGLFSMLPKGKHGFLVSDSMGCTLRIDTTLTQPTKLEVQSVTSTRLRCYGDGSGAIEVVAKGGTPLYKYDFGIGFSPLGKRTGLMSGKLPFIIRDSLGCKLYDTAFISQPDLLRALISSRNVAGGTPSCTDSVRVMPTGGTSPYTLSILEESTTLLNEGYLLYNRPNGRYPLAISDGNGCLVNDTAVVSNLPKPEFRLVDVTSPSCANSTNGRIAIDAWSSTGSETFEWYFITPTDTAFVSSTTSRVFSSARKGRYVARIVDQYFCTTDSLIDVSGPSDIELNLRNLRIPKCNGYANGNVWIETSGGNGAPYSYLWSNGSQVDSTGAIPSGVYSVIASDALGCKDTSYYIVIDPPSVKPNLPSRVTVCANQTYVVDVGIPNVSYLWSSENGFTSTLKVDTLKQPGNYYLTVIDGNGCVGQDTLRVELSSSIIDANFLVADSASVGDTLVIIEMSWPAPDAIEWHYPAAFTSVYHNDYSIYLVPQMEGTFNIGLTSYVGPCSEYIEKTIVIVAAKGDEGKTSIAEPLIKDVKLFPNPNKGDFSVDVYLSREAETLVELYSFYGQRIRFERVTGLSKYSVNINQRLLPGIYLVRVTAGNETRSLRVVVQ